MPRAGSPLSFLEGVFYVSFSKFFVKKNGIFWQRLLLAQYYSSGASVSGAMRPDLPLSWTPPESSLSMRRQPPGTIRPWTMRHSSFSASTVIGCGLSSSAGTNLHAWNRVKILQSSSASVKSWLVHCQWCVSIMNKVKKSIFYLLYLVLVRMSLEV